MYPVVEAVVVYLVPAAKPESRFSIGPGAESAWGLHGVGRSYPSAFIEDHQEVDSEEKVDWPFIFFHMFGVAGFVVWPFLGLWTAVRGCDGFTHISETNKLD